jgi:hypothetical protein
MLNGLDPIILIQFYEAPPAVFDTLEKIPLISSYTDRIGLPPIPIYLSEKLTGLYIDNEDKNVDIQTVTETLSDGSTPFTFQKGVGSTVRINLVASKESIGVTLLSALADQIFEKVSSKQYTVSYLHGAVTIFNGLMHSFSINQNANDDLYNIAIELSRSGTANETQQQTDVPQVPGTVGGVPG